MMKQKMLVNSMSNVESSSDLWYSELRLMLFTLNSEVHKLPDFNPIGPLEINNIYKGDHSPNLSCLNCCM